MTQQNSPKTNYRFTLAFVAYYLSNDAREYTAEEAEEYRQTDSALKPLIEEALTQNGLTPKELTKILAELEKVEMTPEE